jgi:uncharacterized membrane protein
MELMKNFILFPIILVILTSCASKPKLYPNEKYKSVGKEAAAKDVNKCMADAEKFLESNKGKQVAKGAGGGAAVGAAMGAVWGAFSGNAAQGAMRGGAIGAAGGATGAALTPDQIKHNYVNQCLGEKGYQVIGWD